MRTSAYAVKLNNAFRKHKKECEESEVKPMLFADFKTLFNKEIRKKQIEQSKKQYEKDRDKIRQLERRMKGTKNDVNLG